MNIRTVTVALWLLGTLATLGALVAWAGTRLDGSALSLYDIFPVLGLIAFGLMWTHYIGGSLLRLAGITDPGTALKPYYVITGWIVLACILLHPGILIYALWLDGFGLPPQSYLTVYPAQSQMIAIMLGSLSLVAFMLFEFKKKFGSKKWWKYIEWFNVFAMFAILYHGFTLGGELDGWFRIVWFFYALTLVLSLLYNALQDRSHRGTITPKKS